MTALEHEQCAACSTEAPRLTQEQLAALHEQIPEWAVINTEGVQKLQRCFTFSNFIEALQFTKEVGEMAEQYQHHPAILVEWGKATVTWWTHKIKGLHRNDAVMAAKTDAIAG